MATDITSQQLPVIAKDLLIAALQANKVSIRIMPAAMQGEELAIMYNALLNGISQKTKEGKA